LDISLDKQSVTDGLIKISLKETDYLPKVEEKVREYSRKANIKGFRQGKVPSGVIKKMFGKSILVEEVNHIVSHGISDYIKENKLQILGDPLPNHDKARAIDWDTQKDFEFEFQVGMVDDFKYDLSPKVKITSHPIEVPEKTVNETVNDLKKRFGQVSYPETSETGDSIFGELQLTDGTTRNSYITIDDLNAIEQKKFIGVKKEDVLTFNIEELSGDASIKARILNVNEEEAKDAKGSYSLKVTNISRTQPAELNEEFYNKVFGPEAGVTTEAAFLEKVKETVGSNYQRETDHLLEHEIMHHFVDTTTIQMPENFLKLWLKSNSDGQVNDDLLQKEFGAYRDSLKWDLIKNKIAEDHKINVEADEVRAKAKVMIAEQFGGPAIAQQLGDKFDAIADRYLSGEDGKGQMFMRLFNQLRTEKIMKVIRENISVVEKPVSLDEFRKLAAAHDH
jgi:trigger factor